ncbi:hypothetical protein TBLA_0E02290 [Henningerozyma blattae CBS 6284]|uniref:non-specific serine/threonine protein kinase n=1 Tax=Henningerozyma blattae (strain ATCC 34711 / CBS 6284 / DSM 70876 / NBRC 10599 / NRRL Y-10934 / UCD 77-7) TaxID=1071380 RepID=I2H4I0_HENB6|nr:hypothetical protein TBLA_0E02290 [Tetrapisispora blattae CBS 6284]CCH61282.1 hypothetical protein TBLA_0E02290 [Tetrapisispora blattae CBS 6284]
MPFIGASKSSHDLFDNLKAKHSISAKSFEPTSQPILTPIVTSDFTREESASPSQHEATPTSDTPPLLDNNDSLHLSNKSTHAYSYNPLSPNSLSVRLNILKRSLEILISNPNLLVAPTDGSVVHTRHLGEYIPNNFIHNHKKSDPISRNLNNAINSKLNAHSAALQAFVINTNCCSPGSPEANKDFDYAVVENAYDQQLNDSKFNPVRKTNLRRASSLHSLASHLKQKIKRDAQANASSTTTTVKHPHFLTSNPKGPFPVSAPIANKRRTKTLGAADNQSIMNGIKYLNIPDSANRDSTSSMDDKTLRHSLGEIMDYSNNYSPYVSDRESSNSSSVNDELLQFEKDNLQNLLNLLNDTLDNNSVENASNLHTISLFNMNKSLLKTSKTELIGEFEEKDSITTVNLKRILLDSLAVPFFQQNCPTKDENSESTSRTRSRTRAFTQRTRVQTQASPVDDNAGLCCIDDNCTSLPDYIRSLHIFTSGKNSSHQAIFTCELDNPWKFRAANDLACLIFGISNNTMKCLSLLDVLHPASRYFVMNKILTTKNQDVPLTGEIVSIIQPGSDGDPNQITLWASLWAKRKNNMLVCVFEKVPCDDGVLLLNKSTFNIEKAISGSELFYPCAEKTFCTLEDKNKIPALSDLSHSLSKLINDVRQGNLDTKDDELLSEEMKVSKYINDKRYFTLNHLSSNIPCAIATCCDEDGIRLHIHSLPYQAGLFIINTHTLKILGFNKSISKNMFGRHFSELINHSIVKILPTFPEMINFVSHHYPILNVHSPENKGLVFTEHFFRKIKAEIENDPEAFYISSGIDAKHSDGSIIKVDLQLHVMNESNILLWITHSRDIIFKDYNTTPSQLEILDENELTKVSTSNTSASSSLHLKIDDALKDNEKTLRDSKLISELRSKKNTERSVVTVDSAATEIPDENDNADKAINFDEIIEPALQKRLQLAKLYSSDKSRFTDSSNFRMDGDLIKKIILSPTANVSTDSLTADGSVASNTKSASALSVAGSFMNSETSLTSLPVTDEQIGSQKHSKKFTHFLVLQKMGEGAYSKVNMCYHKTKKYVVVIKMIYKDRILVDSWVRDRKLGTIPSEIQIMYTLNRKPHDNILRMIDFFEDDQYYYLETPVHGESGCIDLFDLIEFRTDMTEDEAKLIFKQVASGLQHLHSLGIVHRDIKDENVIIDSKGYVKIIDFGSAAYVKNGPFDVFVGTIDYAAPEVLAGNPYEGKPQDIWALGILLYTIIFKENPFYNIDEIIEGNVNFDNEASVNPVCVQLIKKMLIKTVPKRPDINEVFSDPWLQIE